MNKDQIYTIKFNNFLMDFLFKQRESNKTNKVKKIQKIYRKIYRIKNSNLKMFRVEDYKV